MSDHHHDHDAGHDVGHGHKHAGSERRLLLAALLTGGFMLAEVAGGLIAGSLALIADAGHMLTDSVALTFAWLAARLAGRPADRKRTYGLGRLEVLVAFANGIALFLIVAWIAVEAVRRLLEPTPILGGAMLAVALGGLVVNVVVFAILHGGDRSNLNVRGALLHVMGDLLGSLGALLAAGLVLAFDWSAADPLLSLLVAALVLFSAWRLVRDSGHILLEGAPADLDPGELGQAIRTALPEVVDVHHVHAWSLSQRQKLVTLHARLREGADAGRASVRIKTLLAERFGVHHATLQIEQGPCHDQEAGLAESKATQP